MDLHILVGVLGLATGFISAYDFLFPFHFASGRLTAWMGTRWGAEYLPNRLLLVIFALLALNADSGKIL